MSLRIPAITSIPPRPFLPICLDLQPIVHGLAWLSLIRILATPLGSLSRLILNPVSLILSLEEVFVEPTDDVEELVEDLWSSPLQICVSIKENLHGTPLRL